MPFSSTFFSESPGVLRGPPFALLLTDFVECCDNGDLSREPYFQQIWQFNLAEQMPHMSQLRQDYVS